MDSDISECVNRTRPPVAQKPGSSSSEPATGRKKRPASFFASGPERRTMLRVPRPAAVEIAVIVSSVRYIQMSVAV